jgi:hypothetical protein
MIDLPPLLRFLCRRLFTTHGEIESGGRQSILREAAHTFAAPATNDGNVDASEPIDHGAARDGAK